MATRNTAATVEAGAVARAYAGAQEALTLAVSPAADDAPAASSGSYRLAIAERTA